MFQQMARICDRAMSDKISGIQIPQGLVQQVGCVLVSQHPHPSALPASLSQQAANIGQFFNRIEMKINLRHGAPSGVTASQSLRSFGGCLDGLLRWGWGLCKQVVQ